MKINYFTYSDIGKIAELTEINNHGEAYLFIAKKIKSKTAKEFEKINIEHKKIGHLTPELSNKRYRLYKNLMKELKRKSPEEYETVYGAT